MTMTIETAHGLQTKLYYNSGTYAAPTWVEIKRTKGEKLNKGKKEVTWEGRDSGFEKTKGGHVQLDISFQYRHVRGTSDGVRTAIAASLANGTAIELLSCDGAYNVTGVVGYRAYYEVMKMSKTSETSEAVTYECEAKHTEFYESGVLIEPADYAGSGGSPTTTTTADPTTTTAEPTTTTTT